MRKIYIMCLVLILLSLSACSNSTQGSIEISTSESVSGTSSYDMQSEEYEAYSDYLRKLEADQQKESEIVATASEKPYQQMITNTYPEKTAFEKNLVSPLADRSAYVSYMAIPLSALEAFFPVECLRKTGEENAYTLYKTDEGGLIYNFLGKDAGGNEGRWIVTHSLYAKKVLSKSDFSAIKKGDPIQEVNQIDPTVELYLERWNVWNSQIPTFGTAHLLKDGVMIVHYEKNGTEYKVVSTEFFSDSIVTYQNQIYDCTILPQDYLQ
ncbi:MAG: hypothetical protein FWC27_02075 [Firmicutes bacterium]|nr:hypothetical protein [Bacillota bacterium]